jgi:methyl-accepting chemotaxis protein
MRNLSVKRLFLILGLVLLVSAVVPLGLAGSMLGTLTAGAPPAADVALGQLRSVLGFAIGYGAAVALLLLAGLGLLFWKVVPPLQRLGLAIGAVAAGRHNLTQRLPEGGQDELGRIGRDYNALLQRLQETLEEATRHSSQLVGACSGLGQATEDTLNGMMALHGETDQVATAITEMAATVQEIARNTESAAASAKQANESSLDGKDEVTHTIEAIQALSQDVQHAAETMQRLEKSSEEIGTILEVIRNISEQTNLLALNAAIEAARAGESGRGFAVVADEVRLLARRTQEATQEIQRMIEELQSQAEDAVRIMNAGKTRAETSVAQAGRAGVALERIAEAVSAINDKNIQIAAASEEQSTVASSVNENIVRIARVADATVGAAQQSASASGELATMADRLRSVLGRGRPGNGEAEGE